MALADQQPDEWTSSARARTAEIISTYLLLMEFLICENRTRTKMEKFHKRNRSQLESTHPHRMNE